MLGNEYFGNKSVSDYYAMRDLDFQHKFHLQKLSKGLLRSEEVSAFQQKNSKRLEKILEYN
jgi:hypothetical protein